LSPSGALIGELDLTCDLTESCAAGRFGPARQNVESNAVSQQAAGHYPLEHRAGEIERLAVQGAAMAPDSAVMLERIGVATGWACLDIGCGPGGITDLMAARVGATGRVIGLDADAEFLAYARRQAPANVTFVQGNAYATGLDSGGFDLVHLRFVASTAGEPERLLREAIRLARPGGVVALQDPDMAMLACHPPHSAWDILKSALQLAFASVGADINLGRRSFAMARHAGLIDVQYRPFIVGVRCGDPLAFYLPETVESLRGTILANKLMTAAALNDALARCRAHLERPDTCFTTYAVAQVWGRTPG
jgi:SAM-dependent methyltransferase